LFTVGQGTLSTVKVAGTLFDRHILDHYRQGLNEIGAKGMYATLRESSGPYIEAVWTNFSGDKSTLTEELFTGRLLAKGWGLVRGVMGGGSSP